VVRAELHVPEEALKVIQMQLHNRSKVDMIFFEGKKYFMYTRIHDIDQLSQINASERSFHQRISHFLLYF